MDFSANLYKDLSESSKGNIFVSPYSISAALLLADLGAFGNTDKQIRTALGVGNVDKDCVHAQYKSLETKLNDETQGTTTLAVANKIFTKLGLVVDDKYIGKTKEYYGGAFEQLCFGREPEQSRKHINEWVEKQTRDKIKDLLPEGSIGPLSLLVIVNAIYFKGSWMKSFEKSQTRKKDFHVSPETTVKIDMMNCEQYARYIEDEALEYSAVELPYKDDNITMLFILPNKLDGLKELEKNMNSSFLRNIFVTLKTAEHPKVILGIPKFIMETGYSLNSVLPNLGIVDMFKQGKADFSAMLPSTPDAYVSAAVHKAFVEVNEEGTEAAAATAMIVAWNSYMPPTPKKRFIADHPFMFLIRDSSTDTVLFMGRFIVPSG